MELPLLDPMLRENNQLLEPVEPEPDIFANMKEEENKGKERICKQDHSFCKVFLIKRKLRSNFYIYIYMCPSLFHIIIY